ncbi:MAG: DUF2341 domain-containing protein [Candidatus Hadarchaeales archaeon]
MLLSSPYAAAAGWWDESWTRRRAITISPHPENIHLKIILPFYAEMQPDFRDLRFLENDNFGLLNFWVENYTPDNATIWVRRPENSDNTIYVYYGNPTATNVSSWENTILPYADVQATADAGWSPRYAHTSLVFDNKIWVIGGGAENAENDVWCSADGVNWMLVVDNAGWTSRRNHTSVVFNNRMWVIGGPDSEVWYSENGENWILATSSPGWSARWGHTSIVFAGKIWVIGGYDGNYKNDVWYSSDGVNWCQVTSAAPWSPRHSHSSVVFNNRMWVIGGYSSGAFKNDVWYSSDGENWFQATGNGGWTPRRYHTSVVFDNRMWVIGGNGELWAEYLSDIWYSENGSSWTKLTGVTWSARYEHSSVVFKDAVWVMGGYDGNYRRDVWKILRKSIDPMPSVQIGPKEPAWFQLAENWAATITTALWYTLAESRSATVTTTTWFQMVESRSARITTPSPPPSRISTFLTIAPSSLSILPGDSVMLTATLKDANGLVLSGKTISWSVAKGVLSATATTTDGNGNASVIYIAQGVAASENVVVTASFAGDASYYSSNASLTVTITPAPTTLTISPASFVIGSGKTETLIVKLTSRGLPLSSKIISWSTTLGSLSYFTSSTDNSGQATVIFTAPIVENQTTATITAFFAGDNIYSATTAISTATVVSQLVEQKMEVMENNFIEQAADIGVPVEEEKLRELENAFLRGNLGAVVAIRIEAEKPGISRGYEHKDLRITLGTVVFGEKVELVVENISSMENGTTVVINVENRVLPAGWTARVLLNDVEIALADDYVDALDPTNDNGLPEYYLVKGGRGIQVIVSIPYFSVHTITISTMPTVPLAGVSSPYLIVAAFIVLSIVVLAVVWRYLRLGKKSLPEISSGLRLGHEEESKLVHR